VIFTRTALKAGGKVEAVVQRRVVQQSTVVEEVADEDIVSVADCVVEANGNVIRIGLASEVEILKGKTYVRFEGIDGVDVVEDD